MWPEPASTALHQHTAVDLTVLQESVVARPQDGAAKAAPGRSGVSDDITGASETERPAHDQREPTVKILYIAGLGRNGGTLLDRILGEIPGFTSLGEAYFVWKKGLRDNELCNCGERFHDCPFWTAVVADTFGRETVVNGAELMRLAHGIDRTRNIPGLISRFRTPGFSAKYRQYKDILSRLYTALHHRSNGSILVDSSKFASHAIILSQLENVDLRVLHLVRDSRAVAYSWMKKIRKAEVVTEEAYLKRYSPLSTAVQWSYRNASAQLLKRYANSYLRMRYEDFARNPRVSVARIADWAGVPDATLPFVKDDVVVLGTGHTQSGNPMRFTTGEVRIRPDEKWKNELPRANRTIVTAVTWPMLLAYGYRI